MRRQGGADFPAVPALATLCRCFAGFGTWRAVSEQAAAFEGLATIRGCDGAHAVSEMRSVVQGPTLQIAVRAAARLGSLLTSDALRRLLRYAEPGIRAGACCCARPLPELISLSIDLLDDLNRTVVASAAFALGRMRRIEARPILKSSLEDDPSEDVIDAVSSIADEECLVLLGRRSTFLGPWILRVDRGAGRADDTRVHQEPRKGRSAPGPAEYVALTATFRWPNA